MKCIPGVIGIYNIVRIWILKRIAPKIFSLPMVKTGPTEISADDEKYRPARKTGSRPYQPATAHHGKDSTWVPTSPWQNLFWWSQTNQYQPKSPLHPALVKQTEEYCRRTWSTIIILNNTNTNLITIINTNTHQRIIAANNHINRRAI